MSERLDLEGRHIVLGLSGGIACYKAAELTRELVKAGATVQVVMTGAAEQFITAVTLQALSNRPVYTSQWDAREPNNMAHINLTREADAVLVAPASADFIAKLIHGRADDLLSLSCLARPIDSCPLLVAPAMNREMWAHPATQRNIAQLQADGGTVLGLAAGDLVGAQDQEGRREGRAELRADREHRHPRRRREAAAASLLRGLRRREPRPRQARARKARAQERAADRRQPRAGHFRPR